MNAQDIINQSSKSNAVDYMKKIYSLRNFSETKHQPSKITDSGVLFLAPEYTTLKSLNYSKLVDERSKIETKNMLKELGVNVI
jgi:hypothetical protein